MSHSIHRCLATIALVTGLFAYCQAGNRPNFLWISVEDMSLLLGCYGDALANTPHVDRLAEKSVRYTHAFATAPVCSPSRSTLITGCYAPSLGTQQMRSTFPIPKTMRGFPALLRRHGYYTSNNAKTDYNTSSEEAIIQASWDENSTTAHWRNRSQRNQPFFSVFNIMTTHQSRTMAWPRTRFIDEIQSHLSRDEIHDPQQMRLPPYYPDTPIIRRTMARTYDCVAVMDKQVGQLLQQLEEDGLTENTIVLFFSDHGTGLPRHKRVLLDSGTRVPLLLHFPANFQHLAPGNPGTVSRELVSFVDFAPTMLSLAGLPVPSYMQGHAFAGAKRQNRREFVFSHRDRIDETFDTARSVRDGRFLYVRNFMPHLGHNQVSAWPDQGEINHEFYRLANRNEMTAAQWQFAGPTREIEELYDCEVDPHNVRNLIDSPELRATRGRLRTVLRTHLEQTMDLGFIPESEAWHMFGSQTPWQFARQRGMNLPAILDAAYRVGSAPQQTFISGLDSELVSVRFWSVMGLASSQPLSHEAVQRLSRAMHEDGSADVRIEAASLVARNGKPAMALSVLTSALEAEDLNVVLRASRAIELLGELSQSAIPAMRQAAARAANIRPLDNRTATFVQSGHADLAMFIGFSTSGFLRRVAGQR